VFVDILFKYDLHLHSHFTYHTDDRHGHHHPVLAVVVQLTADESSRHPDGLLGGPPHFEPNILD